MQTVSYQDARYILKFSGVKNILRTNSPSLKKCTLSVLMGAPSLVHEKVGMGLPLTGVVILNFWPSSTLTSPRGRAKEGTLLGTPSFMRVLMAMLAVLRASPSLLKATAV